MSEQQSESFANITFGNGEKVQATRENTTLYNHFGAAAMYDHVWIQRDEEVGGFIWAQNPPDNPAYQALAPRVVENGCELRLNIRTPAESDVEAFGRAALSGIDEIPDWLPEV